MPSGEGKAAETRPRLRLHHSALYHEPGVMTARTQVGRWRFLQYRSHIIGQCVVTVTVTKWTLFIIPSTF